MSGTSAPPVERSADATARAPRCVLCDAPGPSPFERFAPYTLLRCGECDLVFSEPMRALSGEAYAELYGSGGQHEGFVSQLGIGHRRFLRAHGRRARGAAAPTLLDVGCSTGVFVEACRRRGLRARGVEHDGEAVALGRTLFPEAELVHGDLSAVEAGGAPRFDFVTAFEVLEHVAEPLALLRAAAGLLAPGGTLVVFVPNRERTPPLYREMVERGADVPPHHLTKWSRRALERALHLAGLSRVHAEPIGKYRFPWLPALGVASRLRAAVVRRDATAREPGGEVPSVTPGAARPARRYDARAAALYGAASRLRLGLDAALFWPADVAYRLAGYERDGLYAEGERAALGA